MLLLEQGPISGRNVCFTLRELTVFTPSAYFDPYKTGERKTTRPDVEKYRSADVICPKRFCNLRLNTNRCQKPFNQLTFSLSNPLVDAQNLRLCLLSVKPPCCPEAHDVLAYVIIWPHVAAEATGHNDDNCFKTILYGRLSNPHS